MLDNFDLNNKGRRCDVTSILPQIISCSDTKVSVLVVMEYKCASVIYV